MTTAALPQPRQGRRPREPKSLCRFLENLSANTARTYKGQIIRYLSWVYREPDIKRIGGSNRPIDPHDMKHYDDLSRLYLQQYTDIDDHADLFAAFIEEAGNGRAPKTKSTAKDAITAFLVANRIFIPPQQLRSIKTGNRPLTADRIPTRAEVQTILQHGDLFDRAYILMLISTGMRPAEPTLLHWDDIDMETGVVRLPASITKSRYTRTAFLSDEALTVLRQWRDYEPEYLRRSLSTNGRGSMDISRPFPRDVSTLQARFIGLRKKAGLDKRDRTTNRSEIHLHGFRKYFRTLMNQSPHPEKETYIKRIIGHESSINQAYLHVSKDAIYEWFQANQHFVWIFWEPPHNERELRELQAENAELKTNFKGVERDIQGLFDTIDRLQAEIRARDGELEDEQRRVMAKDRQELTAERKASQKNTR